MLLSNFSNTQRKCSCIRTTRTMCGDILFMNSNTHTHIQECMSVIWVLVTFRETKSVSSLPYMQHWCMWMSLSLTLVLCFTQTYSVIMISLLFLFLLSFFNFRLPSYSYVLFKQKPGIESMFVVGVQSRINWTYIKDDTKTLSQVVNFFWDRMEMERIKQTPAMTIQLQKFHRLRIHRFHSDVVRVSFFFSSSSSSPLCSCSFHNLACIWPIAHITLKLQYLFVSQFWERWNHHNKQGHWIESVEIAFSTMLMFSGTSF